MLRRLLKLAALIAVAGAAGVAVGAVLSRLSDEGDVSAPSPGEALTTARVPAATAATTASTATTTSTATPPKPLANVEILVLDAIVFPRGLPSGRREQPAVLTLRVRVTNRGAEPATVPAPSLHVGNLTFATTARTGTPEAPFGVLDRGATRAVTLAFELSGAATPTLVRDRRALITIGARSVPVNIKLRAPSHP